MIRLMMGECLDKMREIETGRVDAVVTDPPYGMKYKSGPNSKNSISSTGKRFSVTIHGDDKPFDPSPWISFPLVAFTGAQHFYDRLPAGGSLHCWDKRGEYKPLDQADADIVWCSQFKVSRVLHLAWRGICRHAEHNKKIEHPTQKPIALMEWILGLLGLEKGATVLDPYMGSGTTGVACVNLGFNFIGIERDPTYFDIATRRISEAQSVIPLFSPA